MLALETTDVSGTVALCEDGRVVVCKALNSEQRSAQSLAPTIQTLLREQGWLPTDVDAVAVTIGPGSFTGLRVGVATAKMFAWAVDAEILGIDALDAVVASLTRSDNFQIAGLTVLTVGIDAQRGDAAVRNYLLLSADDGIAVHSLDEKFHVVSMKKWLGVDPDSSFADTIAADARDEFDRAAAKLPADVAEALRNVAAKDVLYAGPALRRVKNLATAYPAARLVAEENWNPDAAGVALVACGRVERGNVDDVWNLLPIYSRRAAAEEKALEKQKALAAAGKPDA